MKEVSNSENEIKDESVKETQNNKMSEKEDFDKKFAALSDEDKKEFLDYYKNIRESSEKNNKECISPKKAMDNYIDSWFNVNTMSDEEFDAYVKEVDENTADNELIEDVKSKNGRTNSPFVDQEDTNGLYNPDAWGLTELKKGDKVYQIGPEGGCNSCYFTDQKTIEDCKNENGEVDTDKLKNVLQINDPQNIKIEVREYELKDDISKVPTGKTEDNYEYGKGGATQLYITGDNREAYLEDKGAVLAEKK